MGKMILVAEVNVNSELASSLFKPLGVALAPINYYITPLVQDVNYLNNIRKETMLWLEFLDMVKARVHKGMGDKVRLETIEEESLIRIYANEEVFLESIYSNTNYIRKIYRKENLPIIFKGE